PGVLRLWPLLLLAFPILLAMWLHQDQPLQEIMLVAAVLALWCVRCLRFIFITADRNIGRAVSGLLGGIVFVDWLALAQAPRQIGFIFIGLFLLALLFQRIVPAT